MTPPSRWLVVGFVVISVAWYLRADVARATFWMLTAILLMLMRIDRDR